MTNPQEPTKCALPEKCRVRDCRNGLITRFLGGHADTEDCPCLCHKAQPQEAVEWEKDIDGFIDEMNQLLKDAGAPAVATPWAFKITVRSLIAQARKEGYDEGYDDRKKLEELTK